MKRKKYTLKQKAAVLTLIENKMSRHEIEREYGIIEQEILIQIRTCRRHGLAITSNQIIAYTIKITGYDFKNTFNAYVCWVKRFLKRHNLTIRKCSHIGQKIDGDYENQTYIFLSSCIKERIDNHIDDNIECLINVDETPCYIENLSKDTIDLKGVKKVEIITYGK